MCRKWKRAAALGLAVLIGGMMPMGTMLAAEDSTEVVQETDSVSDTDVVCDDEVISDGNESVEDEVNAEDENTGDEANADDESTGDEANTDDENSADEVNADDATVDEEADSIDDQNTGIQVMSEPDETKASGEDVSENTAAPVIDIKFGEQSSCYALGGTIDYIYVNNKGRAFECSVKQNDQNISFFYYLDNAKKVTDPAKEEGQLQNVKWLSWSESYALTMGLGDEQNYVLYVKVERDGQTTYARSGGVVVDTTVPSIVGIEEGKNYPAGTTFTVSDANLSEVMINEQKAEPLDGGKYKVAAKENSTSCVIRAIDKAGNEKSCSITVSGSETPDTGNVISESRVYSLKAGVKYHLAAGKWKVDGDKSFYQGDSDFYVKSDGDYRFTKR